MADAPWPPPVDGQKVAYECRGHWHYGFLSLDDDDDGLGIVEVMSYPLSMKTASDWVLRRPGPPTEADHPRHAQQCSCLNESVECCRPDCTCHQRKDPT